MIKSRIFLALFVVVSTILLYLLPRYVVDNEQPQITEAAESTGGNPIGANSDHDHNFTIPDSLAAQFESIYDLYKNSDNPEKRLIFADSLAKAYNSVGKLDSVAKYSEIRAIEIPNLENFLIAGNAYFEAFNFAVDQGKRNQLAEKVQLYYKKVLEEDPSLLDVKSKMAMSYVSGSNPMQGIMMLREVLEEDPENEMAIYNLGILAITSGQMERAMERFTRLIELDSENPEGNFYMGYCLFETGKQEESKPYFEKVVNMDISGDMVQASREYLQRINN